MNKGGCQTITPRGGVTDRQGANKGKPLPPVGSDMGAEPSKFMGSIVAPTAKEHEHKSYKSGFDPNLLVGPLYDSGPSRQNAIREQMGDITSILHETLDSFDDFSEMGAVEDPLVTMRMKIRNLEDKDMQFQLNSFLHQYEDMSNQLNTANHERDELLLQLADWFTADHIDLTDIKTSLDDEEAEHIKDSYFETMTQFAGSSGKSTKILEKQKVELEKNVFGNFNSMKEMSVQTLKLTTDDAPWKYAADEIVSMLKKVRSENSGELENISATMKNMVKEMEKQEITVKSLTAELRDKKQMVKRLSDENGDLTQDCNILRARIRRFEKEFAAAKYMIRKLSTGQKVDIPAKILEPPALTATETKEGTANRRTSVLTAKDSKEEETRGIQRLASDPALLRSQLRDQQEDMELIRSEFARVSEELEELTIEKTEKKAYIESIELENEKFSKEIKKSRMERRKSVAVPAAGDAHKCQHCKCHLPNQGQGHSEEMETMEEEINDMKKEAEQLQERCNYYKKCLSDTEMKLTEAYKEISELRVKRDKEPIAPKSREPAKQSKESPAKDSKQGKDGQQDKTEGQAAPRPKPKPQVKSRYLAKSNAAASKLPPIERSIGPEPHNLNQAQSREFNLYRVGDLQGRLNMLVSEIMDFVNEIGRLIHTDKDESKKTPSMKTSDFADNTSREVQPKKKETQDNKEVETCQKKTQVMFNGQISVTKIRESFEMLSSTMALQHDEYEAIYRSFKISQQRNSIRREIMLGRLGLDSLKEFDKIHMKNQEQAGKNALLNTYYQFKYGSDVEDMKIKSGHQSKVNGKGSNTSVNSESEEKLKTNIQGHSMQRSKSDLNVNIEGMGRQIGSGLLRERSQVYLTNVPDHSRRELHTPIKKQEVKVAKAVVPRKGQIQLSSMAAAMPFGGDPEKKKSDTSPSPLKSANLIRRKDILDQIKMGNKLLEDSEKQKLEEEEMTKNLGAYTMLDLQSGIFEMTDVKNLKKGTSSGTVLSAAVAERRESKDKPLTLPSINRMKIF